VTFIAWRFLVPPLPERPRSDARMAVRALALDRLPQRLRPTLFPRPEGPFLAQQES